MLLRSSKGKVALKLGGNNFISYISISASGPEVQLMDARYFEKEFYHTLSLDFIESCWRMLECAKLAHVHKPDVIGILRSKLMSKPLNEMTLDELVLAYNRLAVILEKKPRKYFDNKSKAIEAIGELDEALGKPTPSQLKAETSAVIKPKRKESSMSEEKKPRGKGIGARAIELLLEGKPTAEVIATIKAEIEGAEPTPATIAWYKNKLRKEGKLAAPAKAEATE